MSTVPLKTSEQLVKMRQAGRITALALQTVNEAITPGVTTAELNRIAEAAIRKMGAVPSFKGYQGYPASICTSVNEEIVHGIPSARKLVEGDIVSIDAGAIWRGYQGDAAITVAVGNVSEECRRLICSVEEALMAGIAAIRPGGHIGDISHAVEMVAQRYGFGIVREYGGHGIGREMHEQPRIPNWGPAGRGLKLEVGMTLAIEPMFTLKGSATRTLMDDWTVVTADASWAAHWEHTVAINEQGAEILTRA
ncbi:MAG: type I methionyl aminopeptidase [Chloroflexi bacterium]|nr:type I methionyl aminopeptidase [Chloroflexota bacterium]